MSGIAVCTDSSALFPAGVVARLDITVVPVQITLNGQPHLGREDEIDEFYAELAAGASVTTSQPSPGAFLGAYASAAEGGAAEVLSIHLDARVSGTVASAELAAGEAPVPVTVVDTGTVSFGVGACVRAAADAVAVGGSTNEAVVAARELGSKLQNVFVAAGGHGGRIGDVSGWAVLELVEGKTQPLAACGGVDEAVELMAERIGDAPGRFRAAVGHAGVVTEPAADALAQSLTRSSRVVEVERYRVGPAVGAHTGPLSFGAFWWPTAE